MVTFLGIVAILVVAIALIMAVWAIGAMAIGGLK